MVSAFPVKLKEMLHIFATIIQAQPLPTCKQSLIKKMIP